MEPDNDRDELHNEFLAIKATLASTYEAGQTDPEAWAQFQTDKARLFELRQIFEPKPQTPTATDHAERHHQESLKSITP